jgi:hypothetical protein
VADQNTASTLAYHTKDTAAQSSKRDFAFGFSTALKVICIAFSALKYAPTLPTHKKTAHCYKHWAVFLDQAE